jgi:hypothetical protein
MLWCKDRKRQTNRYAEKTIFYANNNKPRKHTFGVLLNIPTLKWANLLFHSAYVSLPVKNLLFLQNRVDKPTRQEVR